MTDQALEFPKLKKKVPANQWARVSLFLEAVKQNDPAALDLLRRAEAGELDLYDALDRFEGKKPT